MDKILKIYITFFIVFFLIYGFWMFLIYARSNGANPWAKSTYDYTNIYDLPDNDFVEYHFNSTAMALLIAVILSLGVVFHGTNGCRN